MRKVILGWGNMTRTIFLVKERSGSTFLTSLLLGIPGNWGSGNFENLPRSRWMNSDPGKQCLFYPQQPEYHNSLKQIIYDRPTVEHNESYIFSVPARCDKSFYNDLPGTDWRFVYLLRDPRNYVESMSYRHTFGFPKRREDYLKIFRIHTSYSQIELSGVEKMISDPRFMLLHFENLINDPLQTIGSVYSFMGMRIDIKFYKRLIQEYEDKYINSSFGDRGINANIRWHLWTPEQKEYFKQHIGQSFVNLGYEKDDSWVTR